MTTFYRSECGKLSLTQLWSSSQSVFDFVGMALGRLVGANLGSGFYPLGSYDLDIVARREQVAPSLREVVDRTVEDRSIASMQVVDWYLFPTLDPRLRVEGASLLSSDQYLGLLIQRMSGPAGETFGYSCTTPLAADRYLITIDGQGFFCRPPNWDVQGWAGWSSAEVLRMHQERLRDTAPLPMRLTEVTGLVVQLNGQLMAHAVSSGLLEPMSEAEVAGYRASIPG
jgi:hypothetical protein